MPAPTHPSEIAREVLRLFATRRLPPTPDNFRTLYHEIAGIEAGEPYSPRLMADILSRLPRDTAERARFSRQLEQALTEQNPAKAREALLGYLDDLRAQEPPAWNTLIANLLRQWELRHIGWTTARKRESVERVLASSDPDALYSRLQGLIGAWSKAPPSPETSTVLNPFGESAFADAEEFAPPPEVRLVVPGESSEIIALLREMLESTLASAVPAFIRDFPHLVRESERFAEWVKGADSASTLRNLVQQLRKFAYRLEIAAGDSKEIHNGQLNLLRLLLENIEEIVVDAQWLHGQVEVLREVIAKTPDMRLIDDAERRLREVIFKQSQLKHNLVEAQRGLQAMLADFVEHLASFADSTGSYHDRIAMNADKIEAASDISEVNVLLQEVMRDTRGIQEEARRSHEELRTARERALAADKRILQLKQELEETSREMRHDRITGLLNRRGMEEAFAKETARAKRRGSSVCLARLDIDDFKAICRSFGEISEQDALTKLSKTIRDILDPESTVARLDGEEFIILCAESDIERAVETLTRLQRELTKTYFMADSGKTLVTFSAGVTPWEPGEPIDTLIARAEAAMQEAQKSGKNKVVARG